MAFGVWQPRLAGAVTTLDVANALAEEGADAAGASFSNMATLDAKTNRVRAVHSPAMNTAIADRWNEFDLEDATPLCDAIFGETSHPPRLDREHRPAVSHDGGGHLGGVPWRHCFVAIDRGGR